MKRTAWDFGSSWEARLSLGSVDEPAETTCDSQYDYLGFRLVSDDANQIKWGSNWDFDLKFDRRAVNNIARPGLTHAGLSFRVVSDREDT